MKLRRPHLKLMYCVVPDDQELQTAYHMLWLLKHGAHQESSKMVKDKFFKVTEALVKQYSPPFTGGKRWDNRKKKVVGK